MTQFLPLTAGGLTYVLSYDPSGTPNQKPSFTSTPVEAAVQNEAYEYTAVATDPEDDTITYSLDTFPTGMTIGESTGVVDWTPTEAGTESVVIRATDAHGAYETQSFSVVVAAGTNDPPAFTSTAVTTATEGGLYAYTAVAEDPEDDAITYSLDTYPTGMTIGTYTGIIHWVPTSTDTEAVVVRATDSNGAYSTQSFNVTVGSFAAAGGVDIDAAWLADTDNGGPSGPYYLDTRNKIYRLRTDVTTDGTAFAIINSGITFNLNGHTITYGNATPIVVTNGSFETGTGGAATGWDATHGAHCLRTEGIYLSNTVYDGDYALKCSGYEGDEYVESTATVTLEANTTYSLSAMFWHEHFDGDNPSTVYVKLINQGDGDDVTVSKAVALWRGIQLTETQFTTDATNLTYKIQAGAIIPSGATTYVAYIDDIKIQRTKVYGVSVSAHNWDATSYPGVTRYGRGTNAVVMNGTVTQGQANSTWGHAIYSYSSLGVTTVDNMTLTVGGPNSSAIYSNKERFVITDNDITSNVQTITSRDNYHGAVIGQMSDSTIFRNIIRNGPHAGICAGNSTIDSNTVQLKVKYTNAFAIMTSGSANVHHNIIDCGYGDYAAEGIMVGGATNGTRIHDNTVTVQLLANNQEYGGAQQEGCYAIQLEGGTGITGCEIYNNTMTAIADEVRATACRLGSGDVSGVYVHDNHFIATRTGLIAGFDGITGTGDDVFAAPLKLSYFDESELVFEDNILESNSQFIGRTSYTHDVKLKRCTLKATGDTTGFRAFESANWAWTEEGSFHDITFVDPEFYDATTKTLFTDSPILAYLGDVHTMESFICAWTTTIAVKNASGDPVPSATVTIKDKDETVVYSGAADENGEAEVVLDEFRTLGDVKTSYNPYTAAATSGELSGSDEFTADKTQTITVVVS